MSQISKYGRITVFLLLTFQVGAQSHWDFNLNFGTVYNVPMPLTISQNGYQDIKLKARYKTEPFTLPVYWDMRFARWQKDAAWEFEITHHKLYLDNTTEEVQHFGISHGFNMLIINRVKSLGWFDYRIGGGFVLAHPENTIRGKTFGDADNDLDMGYSISGPVLNLSVGKPVYLSKSVFLNFEIRSTFAWSRVKVADGYAKLYNWALHAVFGVGFDFLKKDNEH